MVSFLIRRLGLMVVILFIVSVIVFSLVHITPGDPALMMLGQEATPETVDALRAKLGLDQPIYMQYLNWLSGVVQGDLGYSIKDHTPVLSILLQKLPVTVQLTIFSFMIAVVIAIPAGILSAVKKGSGWDYSSTTFALSGVSIPPFFLGILLIYLLSVKLGWLPPSGYVSPFEDWQKSLLLMIMPALAVGVRLSAELTRMLRSSMLEVLQADYIRTAYSKGILTKGVVFGHALKNAMIPVVTVSGLQLATFLGGAVITETIFAVPGLGRLIIDSIMTRDFPVVQGAVLFMATAVVVVNFLVDLLYSVLDPRIKVTGGNA